MAKEWDQSRSERNEKAEERVQRRYEEATRSGSFKEMLNRLGLFSLWNMGSGGLTLYKIMRGIAE